LQASTEFQACEKERLEKVNYYLRQLCEFEKKSIDLRKSLLENFEEAVLSVNPHDDLASYIQASKCPEQTHKYSKALNLLDWNFNSRYNIINQRTIRLLLSRYISPKKGLDDSFELPRQSSVEKGRSESLERETFAAIEESSVISSEIKKALSNVQAAEFVDQVDNFLFPESPISPADSLESTDVPEAAFQNSLIRESFLRNLDDRRGSRSSLDVKRFSCLVATMKVVLCIY